MPRNKIRRPWLDYLVYLAVRLVVAFAQMLTIEQSYALAGFLAWVIYQVDARHRKVGSRTWSMAFGDQYTTPSATRSSARSIAISACMLMEILHTPRKIHLKTGEPRSSWSAYAPMMDRLISGGRPMIFLTGHYGNWELAGYLFGLFGFPTVSVARTLDNPYLDRYLRSFRERTGQSLDPQDRRLRPDGRGAAKQPGALVPGRPGRRPAGLFVDFFGRPASTHKAIALLAIEHRAPVVVGVARRIGPGFRYEIRCEDIIDPAELTGTADDVRLLTQRFTSALERLDPPGSDPVPLAPSPMEASAQAVEYGPRAVTIASMLSIWLDTQLA